MGNYTELKEIEKVPMKIITINVPQVHLQFFEKVVRYGLFPSRSEAMRCCINIAMPEIIKDIRKAEQIIRWDSMPTMKQFIGSHGYDLVRKGGSRHERKKTRVPLGNIMWEDLKLKNGEVVRVPKDLPEEPIRDLKTIKIVRKK